jgi:hypothetical protein
MPRQVFRVTALRRTGSVGHQWRAAPTLRFAPGQSSRGAAGHDNSQSIRGSIRGEGRRNPATGTRSRPAAEAGRRVHVRRGPEYPRLQRSRCRGAERGNSTQRPPPGSRSASPLVIAELRDSGDIALRPCGAVWWRYRRVSTVAPGRPRRRPRCSRPWLRKPERCAREMPGGQSDEDNSTRLPCPAVRPRLGCRRAVSCRRSVDG